MVWAEAGAPSSVRPSAAAKPIAIPDGRRPIRDPGAPIAGAVAAAGYDGDVEVEIFNADVWDAPPDQTAAMVRERFAAVLGGGGAQRLSG